MNIADIIFDRRSKSATPDGIADILGRLIWLMDDNGAEIHEALVRWVESGDLERAEVALLCDEVFLFNTREEMTASFSRLCAKFPTLKVQCDEIIQQWDHQRASAANFQELYPQGIR